MACGPAHCRNDQREGDEGANADHVDDVDAERGTWGEAAAQLVWAMRIRSVESGNRGRERGGLRGGIGLIFRLSMRLVPWSPGSACTSECIEGGGDLGLRMRGTTNCR